MAGFGVLITFVFFIYIVSRDRSQLVGLGIRCAHLPSPPIPATAESQTLYNMRLGNFLNAGFRFIDLSASTIVPFPRANENRGENGLECKTIK